MSTKLDEILERLKTELPDNLFINFIESQKEDIINIDGNLNLLKNRYNDILKHYIITSEYHED